MIQLEKQIFIFSCISKFFWLKLFELGVYHAFFFAF